MRLIDIKEIPSYADIYNVVAQPMIRYDNTEEFRINTAGNQVYVASAFPELLIIFRDLNIDLQYKSVSAFMDDKSRRFTYLSDKNIWLKTTDNYLPDSVDNSGNIKYSVDDQNNPIPTDGCYTQVHAIIALPTRIVCFTSTGVNTVGMTKWEVTGAVRTQFVQETNNRPAAGSVKYAESLIKLSTRIKPNVDMYKFLFAYLHPQSSAFGDENKARTLSFGNKIKKADTDKIFSSPMFERAMINVSKVLFPALKEEIRKQIPVASLVSMLTKAKDKAESPTGSVEDILQVYDKIAEAGYSENLTVKDNMQLPAADSLGNTTLGTPTAVSQLTQSDVKIVEKDVVQELLDSSAIPVDEKLMRKLREESNSIDSFIMLEQEPISEEDEEIKN